MVWSMYVASFEFIVMIFPGFGILDQACIVRTTYTKTTDPPCQSGLDFDRGSPQEFVLFFRELKTRPTPFFSGRAWFGLCCRPNVSAGSETHHIVGVKERRVARVVFFC